MTPFNYLRERGFKAKGEQPVGAVDYVVSVGIFRVRVRIPLDGYRTAPALWIGFTAGGPLIENQSYVRYSTAWRAVQDAVILRRVLSGY